MSGPTSDEIEFVLGLAKDDLERSQARFDKLRSEAGAGLAVLTGIVSFFGKHIAESDADNSKWLKALLVFAAVVAVVAVWNLVFGVLRPITDARMGYPLRDLNNRLIKQQKGKKYPPDAHQLQVINAITESLPGRRTNEQNMAERLQSGLSAIIVTVVLLVVVLYAGNASSTNTNDSPGTPTTTTIPE